MFKIVLCLLVVNFTFLSFAHASDPTEAAAVARAAVARAAAAPAACGAGAAAIGDVVSRTVSSHGVPLATAVATAGGAGGIPAAEATRGPVTGTVSPCGVTFSTAADARDALQRASGTDARYPFVGNVCQLIYSDKYGIRGLVCATITQIAPGIFLGCGHTADELDKAFMSFVDKKKLAEFVLTVNSSKAMLEGMCLTEGDKPADLALIKLKLKAGTTPPCAFLEISNPIKAKVPAEPMGGYVVSCGDIFVAGNTKPHTKNGRALSIHRFQKQDGSFVSSLDGKIYESDKSEIKSAVAAYCSAYALSEVLASASVRALLEKRINQLKEVTQKAKFGFPKSGLMSALADGASGSPLVVPVKGGYKILGMLTTMGTPSKGVIKDKSGVRIDDTKVEYVERVFSFIDLTPHRGWIDEKTKELLGKPK